MLWDLFCIILSINLNKTITMNEHEFNILNKWQKNGDIHASNIIGKLKEKPQGIKEKILNRHIPKYFQYRNELEKSKNFSDKTQAYNKFKKFAFRNNTTADNKEIYKFQSKFMPTIMEEFFKLLIEPIAKKFNYKCESSKAYSQLSIQSIPGTKNHIVNISLKDQDIAIFKTIKLQIEDEIKFIDIPIVAIECKTYLDKTMLEGSASTASRLKQGVTNAKFFVIAETYAISNSVKKPKDIDKIFITKQRRHRKNDAIFDVSANVIQMIYENIEKHITQPKQSTNEIITNSISQGVIE